MHRGLGLLIFPYLSKRLQKKRFDTEIHCRNFGCPPKIKASLETKNGQQYLNISQTQKQLFSFPLKVAFHDEKNNVVMMRYQIAAHENSFALPETLNHKKLRFELDPFTELLFEQQ